MKRVLFYLVLLSLAFLLQNNFFAAVKWIDITPNLLLIVVFCFGFIRGRTEGLLIGFFAGLLSDFFFGTNIGFYAFIYMVIGYVNGSLGSIFYTEVLNMPILLCVANDLVFSLYVFVFSFLLKGATNIPYYLTRVVLPEMVYTVLITLLVYKPLFRLNEWVCEWEKKNAKEYV